MKKALILLTFLFKMNDMMKVAAKSDNSPYSWHTYFELGPVSQPVPSHFNPRGQYSPFDFNAPHQHQQRTYLEESSLNRASRNYRTSGGNAEAPDFHLRTRATERESHVPGEQKFADDAISYPVQRHDLQFRSDQQTLPKEQQGSVQTRDASRNRKDIVGSSCVMNLCEDASDYPENLILQQLKELRQFDGFFNNTPAPTVTSKVFGGPENVCNSVQNTTFPRSAVNTKLVKRYIVNVGKYMQGVTVETCTNTEKECQFGETYPLRFKSVCIQKYTIVPLLVFDEKLIVENFESPSCCMCMYKEV